MNLALGNKLKSPHYRLYFVWNYRKRSERFYSFSCYRFWL